MGSGYEILRHSVQSSVNRTTGTLARTLKVPLKTFYSSARDSRRRYSSIIDDYYKTSPSPTVRGFYTYLKHEQ